MKVTAASILASEICAKYPQLDQRDVMTLIQELGRAYRKLLLLGNTVRLPYVGSFSVQRRAQKKYGNRYTGKVELSKPYPYVQFRVGKKLREKLKSDDYCYPADIDSHPHPVDDPDDDCCGGDDL